MMRIQSLRAWRILDSRGNPTVACKATLECGATGYGDAPAGASTGSHEAHENRDGGEAFGGKDVLNAVRAVNTEIADALTGMDAANQRAIDAAAAEEKDVRIVRVRPGFDDGCAVFHAQPPPDLRERRRVRFPYA